MNIKNYNVKDILYHYVLFYNLPDDLYWRMKSAMFADSEDDALLTYCYLDENGDLSYDAICYARMEDDKVTFAKRGVIMLWEIPEEIAEWDCMVFDEDEIPIYKSRIELIKKQHGYHPEILENNEDDIYGRYRHPGYPDDIRTVFVSEDNKVELIWVRVQEKLGDDDLLAVVLNEPYSEYMGVNLGDLVKLVPYYCDDGMAVPMAILPWMKEADSAEKALNTVGEMIEQLRENGEL